MVIGDYSDKNDGLASTLTVDGISDASITLMDAIRPTTATAADADRGRDITMKKAARSVDEVWREIVNGRRNETIKKEAAEKMTLEDFLMKAGAIEDAVITAAQETEGMDVKVPPES